MNKKIYITLGIVIVALGVLIWNSSREKPLVFYGDTAVACLPGGHQNLAIHIHPVLTIVVDGEPETIPANVGISGDCMAEVHTHDATGILHIETATSQRFNELSLRDFFSVWDKDIEREGYDLEVLQDGQMLNSIDDVELVDRSVIELQYSLVEVAEE